VPRAEDANVSKLDSTTPLVLYVHSCYRLLLPSTSVLGMVRLLRSEHPCSAHTGTLNRHRNELGRFPFVHNMFRSSHDCPVANRLALSELRSGPFATMPQSMFKPIVHPLSLFLFSLVRPSVGVPPSSHTHRRRTHRRSIRMPFASHSAGLEP